MPTFVIIVNVVNVLWTVF